MVTKNCNLVTKILELVATCLLNEKSKLQALVVPWSCRVQYLEICDSIRAIDFIMKKCVHRAVEP